MALCCVIRSRPALGGRGRGTEEGGVHEPWSDAGPQPGRRTQEQPRPEEQEAPPGICKGYKENVEQHGVGHSKKGLGELEKGF